MKQKPYRKIIAFDLSKAELEKAGFSVIFPLAMEPYKQIKKEMKRLGFDHLQKSMYQSEDALKYIDLSRAVRSLGRKLPWLGDCVKKLHTADITNEKSLDMKDMVKVTVIV